MGFFSFLTNDTKVSIPNAHSSRATFPVYMHDDKDNVFASGSYSGYGEFGGKDFFVLLAEMNGFPAVADFDDDAHDKARERGIDLYYSDNQEGIRYPNLTESNVWTWINERPEHCPDQGFFYEP